jgi:uncharacterized protein (DUF1330 family)
MPKFHFQFGIPNNRMGDREVYKRYVETLETLSRRTGTTQSSGVQVESAHGTSGSVAGVALIEAPSYEEALRFVCRETPILDLEWHVQEHVDPTEMAKILNESMSLRY